MPPVRRRPLPLAALAFAALSLTLAACRAPADAAAPAASALVLDPGPDLTTTLRFTRADGRPGPRVLQATVAFPADRLAFVEATAQAAALAAEKQVSTRVKGGRLRVILLSTANAKSLDSGPVAALRFARIGPGPAVVHLVAEGTQLAPRFAGEGLTLGSAWAIPSGVGTIGPPPPAQGLAPAPATGPGSPSTTAASSTPSK